MAQKAPKITEAQIRQLSSEQSFDRGRQYYKGGALFELVRQGDKLRAYCEGSSYEPYRVTVTLGDQGIATTHCTCPYDWGGLCKHIVALLLVWVHQPETFHDVAPLDDLLADRSKEDLIILIKEMLKRQPDLMRLLELPIQLDRQTPLDLDAFRRQINYALRASDHYEYGYPDAGSVATELNAIAATAKRFREGGDWKNAGDIYALILNECVSIYGDLYDEGGDVALVFQDCAAGLGACFDEGEPDTETRRRWLEALLEADLKDVLMGGIDLAYPAGEIVVEQATDEEWVWIEERVQQAIEGSSNSYSNWAQEQLVGFLARRLKATGQDEQIDDLVFSQGSPQQQAFLLIERGRFDEAVAIAEAHFSDLPGLVPKFADALVDAGAEQHATAYMAGLRNTRSEYSALNWLAHYAEQTGDLDTALDWWRQSMSQSPRLDTYQTLRDVAQKAGRWPEIRSQLLAELEDGEAWSVLMQIALAEENVERALSLLSHLNRWEAGSYGLRVAEMAKTSHPQAALNIYLPQVEQLINARGRGNYQSAAGLLIHVRDIYKAQDDPEAWDAYIADLRRRHSNLPALQDELNQAKL